MSSVCAVVTVIVDGMGELCGSGKAGAGVEARDEMEGSAESVVRRPRSLMVSF